MKGVFEVSGISRYDDLITERYHFPKVYRSVAERCVRDWIVYRETGADGGRKAYFAAAWVDRIDPDPGDSGHYYARVSQFFKFDFPVPYRDGTGRFAERRLREMPSPAAAGVTLRGQSIRELEGSDFVAIVDQGLSSTLDPANRIRFGLDPQNIDFATQRLLTEEPAVRRTELMLVNRKIRDAGFRHQVLDAYSDTCAFTGLKLINGGGRAEAQAAHIRPVSANGQDIVTNGLALSGTVHWMFDRGLISLADDLQILVSRQINDPEGVRAMINKSGHALPPLRPADRPHPHFLQWHREHCFKL